MVAPPFECFRVSRIPQTKCHQHGGMDHACFLSCSTLGDYLILLFNLSLPILMGHLISGCKLKSRCEVYGDYIDVTVGQHLKSVLFFNGRQQNAVVPSSPCVLSFNWRQNNAAFRLRPIFPISFEQQLLRHHSRLESPFCIYIHLCDGSMGADPVCDAF